MGLLEDIASVVFGSKPVNELPSKATIDLGDLVSVWSSANSRLEKHDARLLQSDWNEADADKMAHIKNKPNIPSQDGKTYHIPRTNDTEDVVPTVAEVANPISGDTADVLLSNGKLEKWSYDGASWNKDMVISSSDIQFKDELGNTKYSSDADKRTGYYDVTNETYYPSIDVFDTQNNGVLYGNDTGNAGTITSGESWRVTPKNASILSTSFGGGGGAACYYCFKFPEVPSKSFSFDLIVEYSTTSSIKYDNYCKIRISVGEVTVSSNVSTWINPKVEYLEPCKIDWKISFVDNPSGEIIIALKDDNVNDFRNMSAKIVNMFLHGSSNDPVDFYTGWEPFIFNFYYGYANFRIRETLTLEASLYGIFVKDYLGTVQGEGSSISYTEDFDITGTQVAIRNGDWQTVTLDSAVFNAGSTFKYKKKGDRLIMFGSLSVHTVSSSNPNTALITTLAADFRPDETWNPFVRLTDNSGFIQTYIEVQTSGVMSLVNFSSLNKVYTITTEITLSTND